MPYHQKYTRASDMLTGTLGSRVNKRVENQSFPKRKSTNMVDVPLIFHSSSIRISMGFPIFPLVFHRSAIGFPIFHRFSIGFPLVFPHLCCATPHLISKKGPSRYTGHRGPRVGWHQPPAAVDIPMVLIGFQKTFKVFQSQLKFAKKSSKIPKIVLLDLPSFSPFVSGFLRHRPWRQIRDPSGLPWRDVRPPAVALDIGRPSALT